MLLTWTLVALTFIDLDKMLLPDQLTLPLLWGGLLFNLAGGFVPLADGVVGAMAGYLVLWSLYWAFKLLTGKEGMGYGDFKLLAALGAWLGWQALPIVLLLSSLAGAIIGIGLILLRNHHQGKPIPFGPYLAIAGWITLLWGDSITRWYLMSCSSKGSLTHVCSRNHRGIGSGKTTVANRLPSWASRWWMRTSSPAR